MMSMDDFIILDGKLRRARTGKGWYFLIDVTQMGMFDKWRSERGNTTIVHSIDGSPKIDISQGFYRVCESIGEGAPAKIQLAIDSRGRFRILKIFPVQGGTVSVEAIALQQQRVKFGGTPGSAQVSAKFTDSQLAQFFEKVLNIGRQKYYDEWNKERFSLLDLEPAGRKHVDFDHICIWKLYDQQGMANKSEILVNAFRENGCSGCDMVRLLSLCSTVQWNNWREGIEMLGIDSGTKEKIKKILREAECKGWVNSYSGGKPLGSVMRELTEACRALVGRFGDVGDSYFARWLWGSLAKAGEVFPEGDEWRKKIIEKVNESWHKMTEGLSDFNVRAEKIKEFVSKFCNPPMKLPGVAENMVNYLFRDWVDVEVWKYCWKLDRHNEELAKKISIPATILYEKLIKHLGVDRVKGDEIALFNTVIYRMDKNKELDKLIKEILSTGDSMAGIKIVHLKKSNGLFLDVKEHIEIFQEPSLEGRRYLLAAPTSSGKSYIGRRFLYAQLPQEEKIFSVDLLPIVVYLVPLRALAAEVEQKFAEEIINNKKGNIDTFIPSWLTCDNIIRATGDVYGEINFSDKYILVCTYEKFISMLLSKKLEGREIRGVVCDEIQLLGKFGRGANVEELLYLIKHDERLKKANLLCLCINIKLEELGKICMYIGEGTKLIIGGKEYRPIPIANGYPKFVPTTLNSSEGAALVECLEKAGVPLEELGKSLVFIENKRAGLRVAQDAVLRSKISSLISEEQVSNLSKLSSILEKLGANKEICNAAKYGLTCHSANLSPEVRKQIENAFRKYEGLKMLISTTTLAEGVNLPARTVIVNLSHLPRKGFGWSCPPDEVEILNMVGRAGRLYLEEIAYVIFYGDVRDWEKIKGYVESFEGGEIVSTFDELQKYDAQKEGEDVEIVCRFILNTSIRKGAISTEDIARILSSFYWGEHGKNKGLINMLSKYIDILIRWKFLAVGSGESNEKLLLPTEDGKIVSNLFLRLEDLVKIRDWVDSKEYNELSTIGDIIELEKYVLEKLRVFIPEKWLSGGEKRVKIEKEKFLYQLTEWLNERDIDSDGEEVLLTENVRDMARQTLEAMAVFCWSRSKRSDRSEKLGDLCWVMSRRIEFGAADELLPLLVLRIPFIGRKVGRMLHNRGIDSVEKMIKRIDEVLYLLKEEYDVPEEITKAVEMRYKGLSEEDFCNEVLLSSKLNVPIEDVRLIILRGKTQS